MKKHLIILIAALSLQISFGQDAKIFLKQVELEKIYSAIIEIKDEKIPKVNAWFLVSFPVGIGLKQVLDINESRSDSYHMFNAPAAPEPKATANSEQAALIKFIFAFFYLW